MGIDTAEMAKAAKDLKSLESDLEDGIPTIMQNSIWDFIGEDIPQAVEQKLGDNTGNRKDGQTSLSSPKSWEKDRISKTHARVLSADSAPHALPLQTGTNKKEYPIEPKEKELLSWVPDDPSSYQKKGEVGVSNDGYIPQGTWYDEDEGRVFSTGVDHPGFGEYNYMIRAQGNWAKDLNKSLRRGTASLIIQNNFKPAGP